MPSHWLAGSADRTLRAITTRRVACLIVEDEASLRRVLVRALEGVGYQCAEADSGVQAVLSEFKELETAIDEAKNEIGQGAEELATRYGARFVHRSQRRGYKAGAINDLIGGRVEV